MLLCQAGPCGLSSPLQMISSSLRCSCMPQPEPAAEPTKWAAIVMMPAAQAALLPIVLLLHAAA